MANHKSAAKRARQAEIRHLRNRAIKTRVKNSTREFRDALADTDTDSTSALKEAAHDLYRAASQGVLHKRTASRRVSRLMRAQVRKTA